MTAPPDLTQRSLYTYWCKERLRFSDTDMVGHVNNVAFAAIIESGRVEFARSFLFDARPPELLVVARRIEIDYRAELNWPATLDVGSCLLRIGRTSYAIATAVFNGELCAATAITTLVMIDRAQRRPAPIPDMLRAHMEAKLVQG